jgi:aryl-alcohol dehydrogenase-like predicted oxidoreductase
MNSCRVSSERVQIGIGTAQFGLAYGISNHAGQTSPAEARGILEAALAAQIRMLDTAPGYGSAEAVLGECLSALGADSFDVVTKVPAGGLDGVAAVEASLRRLGVERIHGLLAHQASDLLDVGTGAAVWESFLEAQRRGLVRRIGVSVYEAYEIDGLLERFAPGGEWIIQVPLNVLDQRLIASGHLARLKRAGVEIHARSIFLQGLLTMDTARVAALPPAFAPFQRHFARVEAAARAAGLSVRELALDFARGLVDVDYGIFGLESRAQFAELAQAFARPPVTADWDLLALREPGVVLNPALWPKSPRGSA